MATPDFDVIILGGGAGGVAAAVRAAQFGGRVAVVEDKFLGGLCMNQGCVPFGHMMAASRILGSLALGKEMGIECPGIARDFPALMKRQAELVTFMRQGVQGLLNKNKISLINGRGKLAGPGRVEAGGETFSAGKIILAAGAEWVKPDLPGGDLPGVVNSDYLLTTQNLPERCLLVGSGPMIIEIAQFLQRYGTKTWLATPEIGLLLRESKVVRSRLTKALQAQGIHLLDRAEIRSLKQTKDGLQVMLRAREKEESISADILIALRRKAALTGLGLGSVGLDEKGEYLQVNAHMETGVQGLFAIGDMAAPEERHYSHLASSGGIVAAENAMGVKSSLNLRVASRVIFTQPQVACVGLTVREAREAGYDAISGAAPLSMNPLGMILAQNEGIVEVVAEKKYGEILGVHIIGEGASEMAGMGVLAIQMEATLEELARAVFPHPTLSESLAEAARDALGRPIYLP